eukprot:scaffold103095_cov20-Prasinocladus_malaysianus.AAC.2
MQGLSRQINGGRFAPISSKYNPELAKVVYSLLVTDPNLRPNTHMVCLSCLSFPNKPSYSEFRQAGGYQKMLCLYRERKPINTLKRSVTISNNTDNNRQDQERAYEGGKASKGNVEQRKKSYGQDDVERARDEQRQLGISELKTKTMLKK